MTTVADRDESLETGRRLRTVAVVARNPCASVLDAVLGEGSYDVLFIESIDRAYSQIRQSAPHRIVLCLEVDDAAGFQIMSMLSLDSATSEIPIVVYIAPPGADSSEQDSIETERQTPLRTAVLSMN